MLAVILAAVLLPTLQGYNATIAQNYAKLAVITHCSKQQIIDWSCKLCSGYPLSEVAIVQSLPNNITGYVGYDSKRNQVVVAWRGTVTTENWIEDLDFKQIKYPRCSNCQIHQGFYWAYQSVGPRLQLKIQALFNKHPTAGLSVTGHSLGASLALITALELSVNWPNKLKDMYAYGCPRIGNYQLAAYINQKLNLFRVIHNRDPVPHVPPTDLRFWHPKRQILYDEQMSSYQTCDETGEDHKCSDRFSPNYSLSDHTFYWYKTDSSVC